MAKHTQQWLALMLTSCTNACSIVGWPKLRSMSNTPCSRAYQPWKSSKYSATTLMTLNSCCTTHKPQVNIHHWLTCMHLHSVQKKNIPNIINCHSKNCRPMLIIFVTNIFGTTCHHVTGQFTTSPNVRVCTTWEKMNQRNMHWNEQKYVQNHSEHWLVKELTDFNNFWCRHFLRCSCPLNDYFSFHSI